MRILFSGSPVGGHLLPLMPMASSAVELGHEVAVLTATAMADLVDPLPVLAAGPDIGTAVTETRRRTGGPWTGPGPQAAEMFAGTRVDLGFDEALAGATAFGPDLVVAEELDYLGPTVAAALGTPFAGYAISGGLPPVMTDPLARRWREQLDARGLAPVRRRCRFDPYPSALHGPDAVHPADRRPVQPEPVGGPAGTWRPPTFAGSAPLALLTVGTSTDDPALPERMAGALSAAGLHVIATHDGPDVDPRVRHTGFVPLSAVLALADVVVSVGGSGTVLTALWAGVPLVVLPLMADQPLNAARVARLGAGVVAHSTDELAAATATVLGQESFRATATAVREEIRALPTTKAALGDLLAELG